jgi:DNA invertase Pin-like site-specific DNA recombinase
VLNILASVSQWEREAIGERTAVAMQLKASRGEYTGGEPPFGYRVCADGERIEPEPAEQAAIALARQLHAEKRSLRGVARALEERGVRSRAGKGFAPVQIRRMVG